MAEYKLERTQLIQKPLEEVFDFFADAQNLEKLTPPHLRFIIITPLPIKIEKGTLIDYRLRLRGFPIFWKTEITQWNPPYSFVDTALKSPYKQWIHLHTFEPGKDGETIMKDLVRYRMPMEPIGDIGNFLIRAELDRIFDFRENVVKEIFG